jgi:hypothetical protein
VVWGPSAFLVPRSERCAVPALARLNRRISREKRRRGCLTCPWGLARVSGLVLCIVGSLEGAFAPTRACLLAPNRAR